MDSTVDVLSEQPWGKTYTEYHDGYVNNWGLSQVDNHRQITYPAQFMLVKDKKQNFWFRGDLIRFHTGFFSCQFDRKYPWKKWFLQPDDYLTSLEAHELGYPSGKVPKYARLEFGIILSRYKWNKVKDHGTFIDYGSIIMTLTGSKPGHIRRYLSKTPYDLVSRYPYDHIIPFHTQRGVNKIPELKRIQEAMQYSHSKDEFIINMIASFHDENYPKNLEGQT